MHPPTCSWDWEQSKQHLEAYCSGTKGYKKNKFSGLKPQLEALVRSRWAAAYDEFGYK